MWWTRKQKKEMVMGTSSFPNFIVFDPQLIVWHHPLSGHALSPQLILSRNALREIPRAVPSGSR